MRPATTIVLALLVVLILGASLYQLFFAAQPFTDTEATLRHLAGHRGVRP